MIKVGIIEADNPLAGELIRILVNHPETVLEALYAPNLVGRNLISVHHGLIGETSLNFTDKLNPEELDLIIDLSDQPNLSNSKFLKGNENLKFISLKKESLSQLDSEKVEPGLSEINRKALVRTAQGAYILSPVIVPALIALAPLADFLLLNSDIKIDIDIPYDLEIGSDLDKEINTLKEILRIHQTSFTGDVELNISRNKETERGITSKVNLSSPLSLEEIEKIYLQTYDDHNFTFITGSEVESKETEGSQKIVIYPHKPDPEKLELKIVADGRLRGGAGDIVHVMNLFFGLHEKTGLHLKPSRF